MLLAMPLLLATAALRDPCAAQGTALYVKCGRRTMSLCEGGVSKKVVRVALGQGGLDKHVEGDAKVPIGEYSLGGALPSKEFHLFLPVGYPSRQQKQAGYTGSAVGVHGPPRGFNDPTSTDTDWTLGCIAVGTDKEIEAIAEWVKAKRVHRIVIEER